MACFFGLTCFASMSCFVHACLCGARLVQDKNMDTLFKDLSRLMFESGSRILAEAFPEGDEKTWAGAAKRPVTAVCYPFSFSPSLINTPLLCSLSLSFSHSKFHSLFLSRIPTLVRLVCKSLFIIV
jgi:hypothetical protein